MEFITQKIRYTIYILFTLFVITYSQADKYTYELIEQGKVTQFKTIRKGSSQILESFDNLGIIIDHQLSEYRNCQIRQQQLHHKKWRDILLVSNYTEQQFRANFESGRFQSTLPELIAMFQQNNHIFIVRNDGWLIYAKVENIRIVKFCKTQISVNSKIHLALVDNQLIILSDIDRILVNLDFDKENIFVSSDILSCDIKLESIIKMKSTNNLIVIAQRDLGISIFRLNNQSLTVQDQIENVNISDIHLIGEDLYVLDTYTGLIVYNVTDKSLLMDLLRFPGQTFGIFGNSILIANYENEKTKIVDIHLDINSNRQIKINTYYISGQIHQIKMNSDYAILLGNLGNYIIYHSIAEYFTRLNRRKWFPEEFKFPFKHVDQISINDNTELYVGISKHSFMLVVSTLEPAKLRCYSEQDSFLVNYESYSTQCSQKTNIYNDLQACHQQLEIYVNVIKPILTTQNKHYVYVFAALVIVLVSIIAVLVIRKYLQYKRITSNQLNEISSADIDQASTERVRPQILQSPPIDD